jgi:hypothetical protein
MSEGREEGGKEEGGREENNGTYHSRRSSRTLW